MFFLSTITCSFTPLQAHMRITLNLRNTAFSQDARRSRGSRFAWSGSYNVTMYHNKFVFAFSFPQMKEKKVRQTMGKPSPSSIGSRVSLLNTCNFVKLPRSTYASPRARKQSLFHIHSLTFIYLLTQSFISKTYPPVCFTFF